MFSHASVILFTIGLVDTQLLLILAGYSATPCYGVVGTHPTRMFLFKFIFHTAFHRLHSPATTTPPTEQIKLYWLPD